MLSLSDSSHSSRHLFEERSFSFSLIGACTEQTRLRSDDNRATLSFFCFFFFLQELGDLRASAMKNFTNIQVDESNILTWQGLILPVRFHLPFCFANAI